VTRLSRILCGIDFSEPAQAAFRQSLALCRAHHADLGVVLAVPANEPFASRSRARTAMIAALRRESDAAGVGMSVSVQHGDPAGVILLHANHRRCDLLVLGTNCRTGFERLRLGSVAGQVTRRAACPVLVVPTSADGASRQVSAAFRKVVCPIDFSDPSKAALEQALGVVEESEGRLTLVHVLPSLDPMTRYAYDVSVPDYGELLKREAWQQLQDSVPSEIRATTDLRARVVSGVPAQEIVRVSSEVDADLIVMSVTSRGAIGRKVFGSTAVRVMRSAGRPVLAIPERMHKAVVAESDSMPTIAA
jgi:nucleotide-binding universal stress UspA family protein